jgi:hypothetical protein
MWRFMLPPARLREMTTKSIPAVEPLRRPALANENPMWFSPRAFLVVQGLLGPWHRHSDILAAENLRCLAFGCLGSGGEREVNQHRRFRLAAWCCTARHVVQNYRPICSPNTHYSLRL